MTIQSQVFSVHKLTSHLYIYCYALNKKDPFISYIAAKRQNTANLGLQTTREKNQWTFFMEPYGLSTLANFGSLAKVSIPVQSTCIIPCMFFDMRVVFFMFI